jgi:regulator of RNase E activity RraA
VNKITPEKFARLAEIDSPTIANAVEAFHVRDPTSGYASLELRRLYPEQGIMVGYAVTVTSDSTTPTPVCPNKLFELFEAIEAAPKPAVVVIKNIGPDRLRSCHAGDNLSAIFQRLGAVGLVTDGGIRDLPGIRERVHGFHIFSPGSVVSHGTATFLEVGVTVNICGLTIHPGDLLHGDESGLLVVPVGFVDGILERSKEIHERERQLIDFVQGEKFSLEGMKPIMSK